MPEPLNIYLGWDQREIEAYEVAHWSIARRSSKPTLVTPIRLQGLKHILSRPVETRDGKLWCPISAAPMATEFAISRFCVPFLQDQGWALFADCDVLALGDVADLFALADERYAVQVVKHNYTPAEGTKMDGQIQTVYSRKNWSSVILWNCEHFGHRRLTKFKLNTLPGRDLHRFCWLEDSEIGALPSEWNWLVGEAVGEPHFPGLLHYTLGGPWFDGWGVRSPYDKAWLDERDSLALYTTGRALAK